jgi:hypothetical protein
MAERPLTPCVRIDQTVPTGALMSSEYSNFAIVYFLLLEACHGLSTISGEVGSG